VVAVTSWTTSTMDLPPAFQHPEDRRFRAGAPAARPAPIAPRAAGPEIGFVEFHFAREQLGRGLLAAARGAAWCRPAGGRVTHARLARRLSAVSSSSKSLMSHSQVRGPADTPPSSAPSASRRCGGSAGIGTAPSARIVGPRRGRIWEQCTCPKLSETKPAHHLGRRRLPMRSAIEKGGATRPQDPFPVSPSLFNC
jgi:hypothetical protein